MPYIKNPSEKVKKIIAEKEITLQPRADEIASELCERSNQ